MKPPRLPTIFKQNRPSGFQFRPRYYDERQERLDKLRKQYQKEAEIRKEKGYVERKMRRERLDGMFANRRRSEVKHSNRTLLLIIILLLFISYYLIT
ncbi:MAG: hypothetical protein RI565_03670 [Schleiferiaceae bacterium]|nr:hypothetical protein [Schleiferiaceae bacterium]